MVIAETELDSRDKLSKIACLYSGTSAIIEAFYHVSNNMTDGRRKEHVCYGLIMALEVLNNRVGEHAGVI